MDGSVYVVFCGEFRLIPALNTWICCPDHHRKNGTEQTVVDSWLICTKCSYRYKQTDLTPTLWCEYLRYHYRTLLNSFVKNLEHWNVERKKSKCTFNLLKLNLQITQKISFWFDFLCNNIGKKVNKGCSWKFLSICQKGMSCWLIFLIGWDSSDISLLD